jgi:hypothetical protein
MAVNINSVYQKVLALLNKEQRGYLTPQEFNLLADRAQNEIYEAYFHKARNSNAKPKDDDTYTDTLEMIEAKLSPFIKIQTNTTVASGVLTLPTDIYKLINIKTNLGIATEVTKKEEDYILGFATQNNALYPNVDRPIYSISEEEPLVSKILMLSGVVTKQQDIGQVGANAIQMTNQEQNS